MTRWLIPLGVAAMTLGWAYPWSLLVGFTVSGDMAQPLLSATSIAVLLALGAASTRWLVRSKRSLDAARAVVVVCGLGCVLVMVRLNHYGSAAPLDAGWLPTLSQALATLLAEPTAPALATILGLFLWWRGVRIGRETPDVDDIDGAFGWGIAAIVGFGLWLGFFAPGQAAAAALESAALPFATLFFVAGLLTIALGRLDAVRVPSRWRVQTETLGLNSQWLSVLGAIVVGILAAAFVIGQLLSFDLLDSLLRPVLGVLGFLLTIVLYVVVVPVAFLVELILSALLALFAPALLVGEPQPLSPGEVDNITQRLFDGLVPPEVLAVLRALATFGLLAIVVLIVIRTVKRWRPAGSDDDALFEERESVWQPRRVLADLIAWLGGLWRRRTARTALAGTPVADAAADLSADRQPTSVRQVYRALLHLGQVHGIHRSPVTTPFEHAAALEAALEPAADVASITRVYVETRYGEVGDDVARVQDAWARVKPRPANQPG